MTDYEIIDCGDFEKLERIGSFRLRRPSPQAVWSRSLDRSEWKNHQAEFIRKSDGKGDWRNVSSDLPEDWDIDHFGVKMRMRRTGFGHIGAFFEQGPNWVEFRELCMNRGSNTPYRVLNLFAYTGGASIACAQSGAEVVHLDASKTSVQWAKENSELNELGDAPIRYIVDDVKSFVEREVRRENKYEAIILDPPSFGRGTKKQVWKIEDDMVPLLENLKLLKSENFHFISLSSHSQGYTPLALENLLKSFAPGETSSKEMTVPFNNGHLPAGATACLVSK
tara:strand:- start:102511 stop:103350 length:840 start_codon:yes stop_codon:yes gene_type:complete